MHVQNLIVYPIKSCRGIEIGKTVVDQRGFAGDRSFMLVDGDGSFLTQRRIPEIALIEPRLLNDKTLVLNAPGMEDLSFEIIDSSINSDLESKHECTVNIWQQTCVALDQGGMAQRWLSSYLKTNCRLVKIGSSFERTAPLAGGRFSEVSFADHYPVVVATLESLAYLNERLKQPVNISRYRPNIVLAGDLEAFQEYDWLQFKIGEVEFETVRVCDRCSVTTVEQETGLVCKESLVALTRFGDKDYSRPVFGIHASPMTLGEISLDSPVKITRTGKVPLRV